MIDEIRFTQLELLQAICLISNDGKVEYKNEDQLKNQSAKPEKITESRVTSEQTYPVHIQMFELNL